ncbi:MAG: amidohydrolase [Vicinamibacteria bacterium]|nr:amidohydrolase [Vicinamibacteria bacterium]
MNALLFAAVLLGQVAPSQAPPETVFHNARVFTADGQRPWVEAFAVAGGRIAAVGASREMLALAGPKTRLVDLGGAFASPGFGDSHLHFMSGSLTLNAATLDGLTKLEDIQSRIAAYAKANPHATWITGRGWNYGAFPGNLPHRRWLDEVTPDRPAFMEGYDGHTGWANSRALALAGITRDTRDPANGVIVRDAQGEATGALKEAAQGLVRRLVPKPTEDDKYRALRAGLDLAASYGLTFAHNAGFDVADLPVYERVMREGGLKIRFYNALPFRADPDEATLARYKDLRAKYTDPLFRFGAIKALEDGVVESKTAWMLEPYAGGGGTGIPNYTPEELARGVAAFDREGFQIFIHAIGDRAIRTTLDAYENAAKANGTSGRRHRIEHIEAPQLADIARFKPLGVIASTQALFASPDENTLGAYASALGPDRAARAMAFRAIDDSGAVQAFGSDWPVFSMEVLKGIYCAVTRQTPEGAPSGGWQPQSRISAEAALRHFTADGAWAGFSEKDFGRIAPGLLADFVVLSRDITKGPPRDILSTRVLLTVLGGQETYRAKDFTAGATPGAKN